MMQTNIQRISVQPGVRQANNTTNNKSGNIATGATPTVCTLSPCPRNIYLFWEEYEDRIGSRKPKNCLQESNEADSSTNTIGGR